MRKADNRAYKAKKAHDKRLVAEKAGKSIYKTEKTNS